MSRGYFTVSGLTENVIVIERSKFICNIKNVRDEDDARNFIDSIRKKYSLANHNCYAYIADDKGLIQKFSDDGEPQGTAGLPMLEVLKNKRIFKTVAVVTRFFGGIKLGTGGLTRAYGGSVSECLSKSEILNMQLATMVCVNTDYEGYSKLVKLLINDNLKVLNTEFDNSVKVLVAVNNEYLEDFKTKLIDFFNGKIRIEDKECGYFAFK